MQLSVRLGASQIEAGALVQCEAQGGVQVVRRG